VDDQPLGGRAIKVRMKLFGPLVETVGSREIETTLESEATVLQLVERFHLTELINSGLRVAIDGEFISSLDVKLYDAAEVAFLPPVSGG